MNNKKDDYKIDSLNDTVTIQNIVTELYNDEDFNIKPKKIKRRKFSFKKLFLFILIVICFTTFIFSTYKIIKWKIDSNDIKKQVEDINDKVVIEEVKDTENTEIIEQPEEEIIEEKYNPYKDYVQMNMINVDFSELKQVNSDVVGWIKVNGTNINYPYVQTTNNDYYLKRAFDKSYNEAGWVFLDYRNKNTSYDRNTIIYAHGRSDLTMFGSLRFILKNGWLNDTNNFVIKISTETENTMWQIFSVYHIPVTSDYLQIDFYTDSEFKVFTNRLIDRSAYNFNTKVNETDNILTLSTCYNESERMVVHAKLIKREQK